MEEAALGEEEVAGERANSWCSAGRVVVARRRRGCCCVLLGASGGVRMVGYVMKWSGRQRVACGSGGYALTWQRPEHWPRERRGGRGAPQHACPKASATTLVSTPHRRQHG